jgi:hypothetical protein
LSPIVWSSRPRLLGARRFWTLFALQAALIRARRAGFLAVPCRLGASDCRAVLFKSPICECCIHIMGFCRWRGFWGVCLRRLGFVCCSCGVDLSLLSYWFACVAPVRGGTSYLGSEWSAHEIVPRTLPPSDKGLIHPARTLRARRIGLQGETVRVARRTCRANSAGRTCNYAIAKAEVGSPPNGQTLSKVRIPSEFAEGGLCPTAGREAQRWNG